MLHLVSVSLQGKGLLNRRIFNRMKRIHVFSPLWMAIVLAAGIPFGSSPGQEGMSPFETQTVPSPQWRFTVSDPTYPIRPGLTIIYTLSYENIGDAPATNTVIIDTIDTQTEYLLSTKAGIYDSASRNVTWNLGTIDPGEAGIIILRVKTREGIPHGTEVINTSSIRCDEGIRSDNTIVTPITYLTILRVYKSTPNRSASRGQEIMYDIDFSNVGDTTATDVLLRDDLHPQSAFVSCSGDCDFDSSHHSVYWHWRPIDPDSLFSVQLRIQIDSTFRDGTTLVNAVTITCHEGSSAESFCPITIDTTVSPVAPGAPAFILDLKGRDSYVRAGDEMLYRIEYENVGLAVAHSIVLTDSIPNETEYLNCSDGGRYDPVSRTVRWQRAILERRQKKTLTLFLRVNTSLSNRMPLINRISMVCAEEFSASAAETTIVLSAPVLSLSMNSSIKEVLRGRPVTFTMSACNTGNMSTENTIMTNPVPEQTIYSGHTGGGVYNAQERNVTWHLGQIEVNGQRTVSLTVVVPSDFPEEKSVVNRVYLQGDGTSDSASITLKLYLPQQFELLQNYPNPFNQATSITYQLPQDAFVLLNMYNILGQEVATLVNGMRLAGAHTVQWKGKGKNGTDLPSGVYYYRLTVNGHSQPEIKKLVLLR
jgi:uncharacterized repeat protein (TIGR01451 family)